MKLKIISIGPGDPSLINEVTIQAIRTADPLVLRTGHHSLTHWLKTSGVSFQTLDYLYETSSDFDLLTKAAAERLWALASDNPETVLAVPDSMTDHIVDELYASCPENGELECIPGFSFADFYLPACRPFFSTSDIRICPAASFTESGYDPSRPILVTELNDSITAGIIKQQLSSCIRDDETIVFLNGDASAFPIPLFELDRQSEYNHLSAVAAGPHSYSQRSRKTLEDLVFIMDRLRSADGCPWDRAQTHSSLKPYVVEEAWEVVDAIQEKQPDHLAEELGDLLFQIVFHASIGKSYDEFTIDDVLSCICEKMIRRHPHVFENTFCGNPHANYNPESWDLIKQREAGRKSPVEALNDISPALPSLRYAEKAIRKLKAIPGIPDPGAEELISMIRNSAVQFSEDSLSTILFFCAYLSERLHTDSEVLLRQKVKQIIRTCESLEKEGKIALAGSKPLTFNDLGVY